MTESPDEMIKRLAVKLNKPEHEVTQEDMADDDLWRHLDTESSTQSTQG